MTALLDYNVKVPSAPVGVLTNQASTRMSWKTRSVKLYTKGKVFHSDYIHTEYLEEWLDNFTKDGRLLNVCCGTSPLGDVRLDIAEYHTIELKGKEVTIPTSRTQHGDLFDLSKFLDQEFDYVYCDPDFRYYTSKPILKEYKNKWQFELFRLAKKALITRRPKVNINLPSERHRYIVMEDWRPSLSLFRIDWR